MGEPYLGEISMGGWDFAPHGFAFCNGQLLSISQNAALFSMLGTTFGGDGVQTFGLPDLRGRIPIHWGPGPGLSNYYIGQTGGVEVVTLTTPQIPAHNHLINASFDPGNVADPSGSYFASSPVTGSGPNASQLKIYQNTAPNGSTFNAGTISQTGGGQPHSNVQPYLCVTYVIALQGIFPSRN